MNPRDLPPEDIRASAARLVNLIQVLAVNDAATLRMVERCVLALVAEQRRQRIGVQLADLDAEALAAVDALVERLRKNDNAASPAG